MNDVQAALAEEFHDAEPGMTGGVALGEGTLALPGYGAAVYAAAQQFSLPELWASCEWSTVRSGVGVGCDARLASVHSSP
jgi:hypothetical protein